MLYECELCKQPLATQPSLARHSKTCKRRNLTKCIACRNTFDSVRELHQHLHMASTKGTRTCCVCNKSFPTAMRFSRHAPIHSMERPHQCSRCNMTFKMDIRLKAHEKKCKQAKANIRSYQCFHCLATCKTESSLERHDLEFHVKNKPVQSPRTNLKPYWKEDELQRLQGLQAEGKSAGQIAEIINRPKGGVKHKLSKLIRQGLRSKDVRSQHFSRNWTDNEMIEALQMALEGDTRLQIAEAVGRTKGAVQEKLRKARARMAISDAQTWEEDETRQLRELQQEGESITFIADVLNRSRGAVARAVGVPLLFRWDSQAQERLRQKVSQCKTDRQIAKELGTTVDAVSDQRRKIGLRNPWTSAKNGSSTSRRRACNTTTRCK